MAAKKNDYVSCKQFLETNRYLTFDFDYFSMVLRSQTIFIN